MRAMHPSFDSVSFLHLYSSYAPSEKPVTPNDRPPLLVPMSELDLSFWDLVTNREH